MIAENISLDSSRSSLKVVKTGSGSVTAPYATSSSSPKSSTDTIPHNQGTSEVLFSVTINASGVYGSTRYTVVPFFTPDGRTAVEAYVDSNNLYIRATNSTAGSSQPAITFQYSYIMLIP